jgi:hypothetical protein
MTEAKESNIETVKMDDERVVDFPGKRQLQKESFVSPDGVVSVRLDFRNGESRTFTIPPSLLSKFAAHGAEQKLGDEIAGLKKADGKDADIEDKILAIDNLMERLDKGEWSTKRDSSGVAGTSVLIRALMELYGKPVEFIKNFLSDKTQAQKIALRNNPKVKPIVERLEAEKAANSKSTVDTDSLLAGLEGAEG